MTTDTAQRQYRVTITPVAGYIGDYPPYVYVDANNAADAVQEARAYLRIQGYAARNFDLNVERVK